MGKRTSDYASDRTGDEQTVKKNILRPAAMVVLISCREMARTEGL
jgi:hypothetical protein